MMQIANLEELIRKGINNSGKAILNLGEEELATLRSIADLKTGNSSQMAQNILCFGYGECAADLEPESRLRSPRVYNMIPPVVNPIEGNYKMVPNPVSSLVDLLQEGEEKEGVKMVRMFNMNGQVVLEHAITNAKTTLTISQLENGSYLYEILQDGEVVHHGKLIIQK
jgi:hypothetical protein